MYAYIYRAPMRGILVQATSTFSNPCLAMTWTGTLPTEILEFVVDFVFINLSASDIRSRTVYRTLLSCATTCKSMYPRSQFLLLRQVILTNKDQLLRFLRFLSKKPYLAEFAQELVISPVLEDSGLWPLPTTTGKLVNLRAMSLRGKLHFSSPAHRMYLSSVRALHISDVTFQNVSELVRLVRQCADLRTLELHSVDFVKYPPPECLLQPYGQPTRLEALQIRQVIWRAPYSRSMNDN